MGVSIDITDQRRAEEETQRLHQELSHVARVAMMGEITASLAHELSQPLTAILSNAQVAQRMLAGKSPDLGEIREILADIVADDQRAGGVVASLRGFLRKTEFELLPLDAIEVVQEVAKLLRSDAALRHVLVQLEFGPGPLVVRGDRIQLQQVLLNLMVNALDAMRETKERSPRLTVLASRYGEETVRICVTDCGPGIHRDQMDKIFEPFFTSKPGGMGMGLAIACSIARAHGGRLWAENNPGGGATFSLELPVEKGGHG
jgi:C4-dicarboxylate-specific signal transduction histidine kinase